MSSFSRGFNNGFLFGMLSNIPMFSCFNSFRNPFAGFTPFFPSFSIFPSFNNVSYPMQSGGIDSFMPILPSLPNLSSIFNASNYTEIPAFTQGWDTISLNQNDSTAFSNFPYTYQALNTWQTMPNYSYFNITKTETDKKPDSAKKPISMTRETRLNALQKYLITVEGGGTTTVKGDRGGRTNKGVTQGTYDTYRTKHHRNKQDVSNMTQQEYLDIIDWFWEESGASSISDPVLAFYVFAMDWGSGFGHGKKILAKSGNNPEKFENLRIQFYDNIVAKNPSQKKFQKGWHNRVARDKNFAYNTFAA